MIDLDGLTTPQLVKLALDVAALLRERAAPIEGDAGAFYEQLVAAGPAGVTVCHLRATLVPLDLDPPLTLNGSAAQPRRRGKS